MRFVPSILHEIELEYTRSRGPGGQHVNKTNSAALLRWNVRESKVITFEERQIIEEKMQNVMTKDGDIYLRCDEFRDQESNRKKCLEKLEELFEKAFFVQKKRKATKPTKASKARRITAKKVRGEIKAGRGKVRSY
jgi:ribosome-associated protein